MTLDVVLAQTMDALKVAGFCLAVYWLVTAAIVEIDERRRR